MSNELKDFENFYHDKFGYCYYAMEEYKNPIVYNLFIEEKYRKNGHATRILKFVINEIRKTGYKGLIDIEASPKDDSITIDKLISFYKSFDFNIIYT